MSSDFSYKWAPSGGDLKKELLGKLQGKHSQKTLNVLSKD